MNGKMYTSTPDQTALPIDFVVVGGSIAGLACAIALRRVGHRVLVLEKNEDVVPKISGGCRLPPNMTKVLFHWGLEEPLRAMSLTSETIQMALYSSGEVVGTHLWEEEVLKETGGDYIFMHYVDVHRLFHDTAVSYGAEIRVNSEVVSLHPDDRCVKLASGEVIRGDVIVGADGPNGLARKNIIGSQDGDVEGVNGNLTTYNTIVPASKMRQDSDLAKLQNTSLFVWLGNGRCALGFPIGKQADFALILHVPFEDNNKGSWAESTPLQQLQQAISPCEPILHKLAQNATLTSSIPNKEYEPFNKDDPIDWVHGSGRMVLIGEAAHPYPAGSIQACGMAVEDGAVLAKLFSHLNSEDQIGSFLWAFQDLRQERCEESRVGEANHNFYMTMPEGDMQDDRNRELRTKYAAGFSAMSAGDGGTADQWEGIKTTFGYDAEYEADNWWMQWGLLRERARQSATQEPGPGYIDFSGAASVSVVG